MNGDGSMDKGRDRSGMRLRIPVLIFLMLLFRQTSGQVTGLEGWNIFLDPGHSGRENMGVSGYSEAERNLRVALHLRDILLEQTDIDTVFVSRTNDQQVVTLTQRTDLANSLGAAWFHSIHSDASTNPNVNRTLLLWGQTYDGKEKVPNGGMAMSDIMVDILTRGMRTTTSGSRGDCGFYSPWTTPCTESWPGPWLHVNRNTTMPSELSEAGFHTNPTQDQLFMNAEWKKLEAMTFYWSILEFFGIVRPFVGICTGIVYDMDSDVPINGARITLDGQTYTTDTYASLFNRFTSDPDKLHNGFYYIENLSEGTFRMIVEAEGYLSDTSMVTVVDTFFTFNDVELVSTVPPVVLATTPAQGDTNVAAWEDILILFSRRMDQASVESAFSISPSEPGTIQWEYDSRRLRFSSDSLDFETEYTITISAEAAGFYGHAFDGNGDGEGGDAFTLDFKTGPSDLTPPRLVDLYPPRNGRNIERRPVVNATFDEILDSSTVSSETVTLERIQDQSPVAGTLVHYQLDDRSVISVFPEDALFPDETYRIYFNPGYADRFGNQVASLKFSGFQTAEWDLDITLIDDFEENLATNWWGPQQSGSTTGIITEKTGRGENQTHVNLLSGSIVSHQIDYGWDENAASWLIRVYLNTGPPRSVTFDSECTIQVYVFGDGSGNLFRFCVDDKVPLSGASNHEVSPWIPVDWYGWRLVSWDMTVDGTGSWIGDGNLDGTLRIDSIQLTYEPGSATEGTMIFDDLRLVKVIPAAVNAGPTTIPDDMVLFQNYPNPFNPSTTIRYRLSEASTRVRLEIFDLLGRKVRSLVDQAQAAGEYTVEWDGRDMLGNPVASGHYVITLSAGQFSQSRRMLMIR